MSTGEQFQGALGELSNYMQLSLQSFEGAREHQERVCKQQQAFLMDLRELLGRHTQFRNDAAELVARGAAISTAAEESLRLAQTTFEGSARPEIQEVVGRLGEVATAAATFTGHAQEVVEVSHAVEAQHDEAVIGLTNLTTPIEADRDPLEQTLHTVGAALDTINGYHGTV